jgi:LysR family hca operon transcriptional activator
MELRHLRYFVAVAEEGSVTLAATRLHTSQPSLSRQIRELEAETGTPLLTRSVRGVALTPAGQAFLEHARLALSQAGAAVNAARLAVQSHKAVFRLGFLTGQEMDWLAETMRILRDELPNLEVTVSSQASPCLADALRKGSLDLAFMRREDGFEDLEFKFVTREPLVVAMPSDHALTARESLRAEDLFGQRFVGVSDNAPVLGRAIDDYLRRIGLDADVHQRVDNLAMMMSMVASTRSLALLPEYAKNFLPWSVVSRPIEGEGPGIDLVVGYSRSNPCETLGLFMSRFDTLLKRARKTLSASNEAK